MSNHHACWEPVPGNMEVGPFWTDGCNHGRDCFIGSFRVRDPKTYEPTMQIDVYIFNGNEICIRYGPEAYEYFSPGLFMDMVQMAFVHRTPHYRAALQVIDNHCKITVAKT